MHFMLVVVGLSFIALARDLKTEGYKYVLSEKLVCQDSAEQLFASQRAAGGASNSPTVDSFQRSLLVRETTKAVAPMPRKGNCRGGVARTEVAVDETPLKKKGKR